MAEISEFNSISLKSCTPIPVFSATHQWKKENWFTDGIELGFSTKRFNKNNITKPPVSFWALLFHNLFHYLYFYFLSWTEYLIGNWKNQHQALDLSVPSTYTSCLWDFLNKKSELACELIQYTENMLFVSPCEELTLHCWYWHSWLC